jgi:Ulp1 family protease
MLGEVDLEQRTARLYDSLGGGLPNFLPLVQTMMDALIPAEAGQAWRMAQPGPSGEMPRQTNMSDRGIYVCLGALRVVERKLFMTQTYLKERGRMRIARSLLTGALA